MSEKKQGEVFPLVKGYELVAEIGGGGFSVVYRAVNFKTASVAACKVVSLTPDTPEKARVTLNKEISVHVALKHTHVLEFMDYLVIEPQKSRATSREKESSARKRKREDVRKEDRDDDEKTEDRATPSRGKPVYHPGYYMLLEIAGGGDLFDKIEPDKGVGIDVAHHYFRQLAAGVEYIHERGICHRDLKPENILLDSGGVLKISDFGLCSVFKINDAKTGKPKTRLLSERCGSKPYMAPEQLAGLEPYEAEPVDVWGIGIILYTLLSGSTPWDQADPSAPEFAAYLDGALFNHAPWKTFDRDALALLTGLLTPDPAARMTLPDVFHHAWVRRENALTARGALSVAEALTRSLRTTGDLDIATPPALGAHRTDRDGDTIMLTAAHYSQFTQTLLLFSQTAAGQRYTPGWTRFYAAIPPAALLDLVVKTLEKEGTKHRVLAPREVPRAGEERLDGGGGGGSGAGEEGGETFTRLRVRIAGFDRRKLMFRGTIELEPFARGEFNGTFCVMNREKGNPISWRQLWKGLIMSPLVEPHVLRKRAPAAQESAPAEAAA